MVRHGLTLAIAILVVSGPGAQRRSEPFVPVGVWYGGGKVAPPYVSPDPASERDGWRTDLRTIKALGFNSITGWVDWRTASPERTRYDFAALEQLLTLADEAGLKVIVQVYTDAAPDWLMARHPDAKIVVAAPRVMPPPPQFALCPDHFGVRTEMAAFVGAAARQAAAHPSFHAIDVRLEPTPFNSARYEQPAEFCYCPRTQARFREWLKVRYGTIAALNAAWSRPYSSFEQVDARRADFTVWRLFEADRLREDLKGLAEASPARGAHPVTAHSGLPPATLPHAAFGHGDDWLMTRAVDQYGTSIHPGIAGSSPAHLGYGLDAARSAAQDRGWRLAELQAGPDARSPAAVAVTGADLRLWGWAALSRGARSVSYLGWFPVTSSGRGSGMVETDGRVTERARTAGAFAGEMTRNARLYAALGPRASRVATLFNAFGGLARAGEPVAARDGQARPVMPPAMYTAVLRFYTTLFDENIQVDMLHPDDLIAGAGSKYRVIHLSTSHALPPIVTEMLKAFVKQGGTLLDETARPIDPAEIRRSVAAAGVTPDIRIDGARGLVEARFLESADALLLIAINHADTAQKVTMRFTPDTPEAIWQNMETGAAVNFIQGPDGPVYPYSFAARDVLVLVRGKRLR